MLCGIGGLIVFGGMEEDGTCCELLKFGKLECWRNDCGGVARAWV